MSENTVYEDIKGVEEELMRCMKCGNCMAVCPVYATDRSEGSVARGKLAIAEAVIRGELSPEDPEVIDLLYNCLVCKSCMQNCPTGVNFDKIMLGLRSAIVRKNGLPALKRLIFKVVKNQSLFDRGMKVGALLQSIAFRGSQNNVALSPRSPFALAGTAIGFDSERLLPKISSKSFREQIGDSIKVKDSKTKAVFFTGCSVNYFYPEIGFDLIEVLRENKVDVLIPNTQQCCGIAMFVHGDVETIKTLARANLDAAENSGAKSIITVCGSCGSAWRHEYPEILSKDPEYSEKAKKWAERVFDISDFLLNKLEYREPQGEVNRKVTYHDSCHLKKTMRVFKEPRALIGKVPGVVLQEMTKPDACCGSGGSYVLTHYETSKSIGSRKISDINNTGADEVLTGCPACIMQLIDQIGRFGKGQKVRHYISLIAESYRREKNKEAQYV